VISGAQDAGTMRRAVIEEDTMRIAVMGTGATLGQRLAPLLEPTAMLWIHLALFPGLGPQFAFGLRRR